MGPVTDHPAAGSRTATAVAHPNIALVKYWGKRDATLNLPATGSVSITLDTLTTRTTVTVDPALDRDHVILDGRVDADSGPRITTFLDLVRQRADTTARARVDTANTFPTGAGLASSASGFAALAVAAVAATGMTLTVDELSVLARRGSGSAARSLVGGFAAMDPGHRADGSDALARQIAPADHWPLSVVIALTDRDAKAVPSTVGMTASAATSPYYDAWVAQSAPDCAAAIDAIARRDLAALAAVTEASTLAMHAVMMATRPGLIYWSGATVDAIHRVRRLREVDGRQVFFTVDAGPQVKAVCEPADAPAVAAALREIPGVLETTTVGLGPGAHLVAGVT